MLIWLKPPLTSARAAETADAAVSRCKVLNQREVGLQYREQNQLRNAIARFDGERAVTTVPARHHQFTLIVGIDQTDQVTEHDAVLMAQSGAREDGRRDRGIIENDRQAGADQLSLTRFERERLGQTGAQIHAGRAGRAIGGQFEFGTHARVEDFKLYVRTVHGADPN